MSRSGQAYVAATEGTRFTLYAVMKSLGLHITPSQEAFQQYLESIYPPVAGSTREPRSINEDDPREER